MSPPVSVIIPTYNCDRYLAEAIESVLQQTYSAWELIIVDDGSMDNTSQVVQPYAARVRYVYQENQGVSAARNHGMQLAQGEFIAFLDADDFFLPHKLAAQVAVFQAQPQLGMVHSGWWRVDAVGKILIEVEPWHHIPTLNLESWLRWKPVLPSAMMFRRDWLDRSGGFDPRFPPAEDTDLVLRLALMGCEADWLRQITTGYRQHEGSAMHKGLPQAKSLAAVIDHFFAQPDLPEPIRWLENSVRYNTLVWSAWYLHYTGHPTEMVQFLQQSWQYTPYLPMETVVHWADSFTEFARNWGVPLDIDGLGRSPEWQALLKWTLKQSLGSERRCERNG